MKKIITVTAAFGIMASMATSAFAAETTTTTGTTTTTTANGVSTTVNDKDTNLIISTPIITSEDVVTFPKEPVQLLKTTFFYNAPNGKRVGALSAQIISTTGNKVTGIVAGTWVEVYTWLGTSWILVD
ncbi:hypothetical protein [Paenibacillus sp. IHBB 10380]|uniref:hypothetical protein n=1 Tax=Paenibacillus sp. IHBB 10380 TaxID=1566358 RepID=UPI0005CFB1B4|nr:hypothetical protein [Paenibacillus sp. IHBB 10380]AJS60149.1 hypothetical protein UB51_18660 [Paenibacillus sp. IHBB 10380]